MQFLRVDQTSNVIRSIIVSVTVPRQSTVAQSCDDSAYRIQVVHNQATVEKNIDFSMEFNTNKSIMKRCRKGKDESGTGKGRYSRRKKTGIWPISYGEEERGKKGHRI